LATIYDVAELAGVSIATVSRALRNLDSVGEGTRERVIRIAEEIGYRPNRFAQALVEGRSRALGLLIPPHDGNPYFGVVMHAANRQARAAGFDLVVAMDPTGEPEGFEEALLSLRDRRVDGCLLFGTTAQSRIYEACSDEFGRPVVWLGARPEGRLPVVMPDEEAAGYEVPRHLLELGHSRIVFLGCQSEWRVPWRREHGYGRAMEEAGLTPALLPGTADIEGGAALARQMLEEYPMATAALGCNDQVALGAMGVLREAGVRIPDDVSVAGLDDNQLARHMSPPLTTVDLCADQVACEAVRLLLAMIEQEGAEPSVQSLLLRTTLVPRATTAPPSRETEAVTDSGVPVRGGVTERG
jgi:DNA-binding LacI/PurR family transcriptional regulator